MSDRSVPSETEPTGSPCPHGRVLAVALALGSLLLEPLGCGISPKPEPPEVFFDPGAITNERAQVADINPLVDLSGAPGAAEPVGATVRAYPLDSTRLPYETTVAADGSFLLQLAGNEGAEIRVQILAGSSRSEPLDVVLGPPGTGASLATRSLGTCLELAPPAELDLAEVQVVRIRSTCGQDVTLAAPVPRRPLPELVLGADQTWPATLRSGEELTFSVALAGEPGFDEEIFFVEATAPSTDRRPITVRPP